MSNTAFSFAAGLTRRVHRLEAEEPLFLAGQRVMRLFYVQSGTIRLMRALGDGGTAVMQHARANEWVAEASLFSPTYHCDAVASEATLLVSVSKQALLSRFEEDGKSAVAFAQTLASQLRALRQMHEIVRVRRADERVLAWLALRASGNPATVALDRTWSDVADELALTREAVYRAIGSLKRAGRIRIEGENVVIVDARR